MSLMLYDWAGQPLGQPPEPQDHAATLLGILLDTHIADLIIRRKLGTLQSLSDFVGKLRLSMVQHSEDPLTHERRPFRDSKGNLVYRRLSPSEMLIVRAELLRLLADSRVRIAIILRVARTIHHARGQAYLNDATDTLRPPPPVKQLIPEARRLVAHWGAEILADITRANLEV